MMEDLQCWQANLQHSKTASATLIADLEKTGKPCLVLIQEPHVYKNSIRNLNSKNYSLFSGGAKPRAAILGPRTLNLTLVERLSEDDFTCCILDTQIKTKNLSKILIVSGYFDITFNPQATVDKLQQIFDFANQNSFQILLGADTNSWSTLWGCKETNRRGEVLEDFVFRNSVQILNEGCKPTFETCRAESIIDVTFTSSGLYELVQDWKVEDGVTFSDHKRVSFRLKIACEEHVKTRCLNNTDWNLFNRVLDGIEMPDHPIWTTEILDKEVDHLNKMIKLALETSCPEKSVNIFRKKQPNWWNDDISSDRQRVRRKHKKARRTMLEEDWTEYRSARSTYKKKISEAKRQAWRDFVSGVQSTKDFARLIKNIGGSKLPQAGLFRSPDGAAATNLEDSIQNVFDTMFPGNQEVTKTAGGSRSCTELQMQVEADFITEERIVSAINSFGSNKSPGPDGIKPIILKNLKQKSIKLLKKLYMASLTLKYVPKAWREAKVALLPKPGKKCYDVPNSYRPISLTSFVFKTLERVILWQIEDAFRGKYLLCRHQHAYVRGKSCETALSELINRIEMGVHRGQFGLGVFLDIQGAFNNVNPAKAIEAMNRKGINPFITKWYGHYLRSRTATININGTEVTRTLPKGLPQGGIISPLAWDLVIDNLLVHLNKEKNISAIGYADDVAIVLDGLDPTTLVNIAQSSVDKACRWGRSNDLNFNASKTEAVFFTRRRKPPPYKPLFVNGEAVKYSEVCKYLGVTIDSKLNWKTHIQNKIDKCKKLLHTIKAAAGRKWGTNPALVRWAYTGIVRPTLAYGAHVWWSFTPNKTTITQLNRLSRLACLSIAKVHRSTPTKGLEMIYNLAPLEFFLGESVLKAYSRISGTSNSSWTNPGGLLGHVGRIRIEFEKLKLPHIVAEKTFVRKWNRLYKVDLDFERTRNDSNESTKVSYVYTDGSKIHDKAGFGFVVVENNQHQVTVKGYLGKATTVYQAEVEAVANAADHLVSLHYLRKRIKFRIDNQAAVRALASPFIKSKQVLRCFDALQRLANYNRVSLTWIKAHAGHAGNELADQAAKAGCQLAIQGPEPFFELPMATVNMIIKTRFDKKWCRQWSKSVEYLHTKKFYPGPSNRMSKILGKIPREQLSLLVQVITGHCNLLYHSRHYKSVPEDEETLCRLCLEEDEKPWHILTECPALNRQREALFGSSSVLTNKVSWSPKRLLTFFTEHSIQQLFDRVQ